MRSFPYCLHYILFQPSGWMFTFSSVIDLHHYDGEFQHKVRIFLNSLCVSIHVE